jgi:hypothetical protein
VLVKGNGGCYFEGDSMLQKYLLQENLVHCSKIAMWQTMTQDCPFAFKHACV